MIKKKSKSGRSGGSGFKYKPRTAESVKKRAEQQGGQFDSIFRDGVDKWRPKDGDNTIRILPPTWDDHEHYGFDIWIHGYVGADKSTYLCPQKMKNKPCPICEAHREAKNAGEDEEAKQLAPRRQVAVWIIDRDDEKTTPSLFTMSWSMDRDIAALTQNKRTGKVLLIDHPDEGYDISFSRTGKGLNTRYIGMAVDRDSSPIMSDERDQEKILEYIQENPIPSLLKFYSEEHLQKVIEGGTDERDEDFDEEDADDEAPGKGRKKAKPERAKSRRDEDDEEDEDERPSRSKSRRRDEEEGEEEDDAPEDDDVEESDEDDEPAPRKSKSRRDADEDEDVEDEDVSDDEEEDDEPAPRKGKAKSRRDEPDDEDEEEADDPDDEEEDDEPAPRKSKPKSRRDEDEDEDEEVEDDEAASDDEEEDEDPPPRKPAKRAASKRR